METCSDGDLFGVQVRGPRSVIQRALVESTAPAFVRLLVPRCTDNRFARSLERPSGNAAARFQGHSADGLRF